MITAHLLSSPALLLRVLCFSVAQPSPCFCGAPSRQQQQQQHNDINSKQLQNKISSAPHTAAQPTVPQCQRGVQGGKRLKLAAIQYLWFGPKMTCFESRNIFWECRPDSGAPCCAVRRWPGRCSQTRGKNVAGNTNQSCRQAIFASLRQKTAFGWYFCKIFCLQNIISAILKLYCQVLKDQQQTSLNMFSQKQFQRFNSTFKNLSNKLNI